MTTSSKAVATSMLYQNQKWHFFKCKCVTAKKCPFLTTWTIVTRPTHMIFTQKVLPQVELIRSNFPDQKTFDQWLIISRKHPVTLRKKKLHPDLGYTEILLWKFEVHCLIKELLCFKVEHFYIHNTTLGDTTHQHWIQNEIVRAKYTPFHFRPTVSESCDQNL